MKKGNQSTKGINVSIKSADLIKSNAEVSVITGITTDSGIFYYDIATFAKKYRVSDKTIRRRIDAVKNYEDKWRYVIAPDNHKNFVSPGIYAIADKGRKTTKQEYVNFLKVYPWVLKGTLAPQYSPTAESCRKSIIAMFNALKKEFIGIQLIMWYVTEQNPNKDGYHTHFVLGSAELKYETFLSWLFAYYTMGFNVAKVKKRSTNCKFEHYDIEGDWLDYALKQMERLPDAYGWLDNLT